MLYKQSFRSLLFEFIHQVANNRMRKKFSHHLIDKFSISLLILEQSLLNTI